MSEGALTDSVATEGNEQEKASESSGNSCQNAKSDNQPASTKSTVENVSQNNSLEDDLLGANSLCLSDSDGEDLENEKNSAVRKIEPEPKATECSNDRDLQSHSNMVEEENITIPEEQSQIEENETEIVTVIKKKKKKFSAILDSDSDSDDGSKNEETLRNQTKIQTEKEKQKIFDFESSDNGDDEKKVLGQRYPFKSGLIDSDSDSNPEEEEERDDAGNVNETEFKNEAEIKGGNRKKPMRASAKKALDEMQEIQSGQQRLHRESTINLPYHKPKHCTLQEFLKRRTIIKPADEVQSNLDTTVLKTKSLKMSAQELEEYAKLMEERASEATEFFKEEEEEEMKDNVDDMTMDIEKQNLENFEMKDDITGNTLEVEGTIQHVVDAPNIDDGEILQQQLEKENTIETRNEQDLPQDRTPFLITEVLELPNIDLSTLNFNEKDSEHRDTDNDDNNRLNDLNMIPKSVIESDFEMIINEEENRVNMLEKPPFAIQPRHNDNLKKLLHDQNLNIKPFIKGNVDMIIDLESNDMVRKPPTGADKLLERLLAKHRTGDKMNRSPSLDSSLNSQNEMTMSKITSMIDGGDDTNAEHKPGAAYFKLKQNLKTLIKKERLEEIKKKQESEIEHNKCLENEDLDEDEDEEYDECDFEDDQEVENKEVIRLDDIAIDDEENNLEDAPDDQQQNEEEYDEEENEKDEEDEEENDFDYENENEEKQEKEEEKDSIYDSDNKSNCDSDDDAVDNVEENGFIRPAEMPMSSTQQRKSRIIRAFNSDSDTDDMELLKTQIPMQQSNIESSIYDFLGTQVKNTDTLPCSLDVGVTSTQELMNLCSGAFDIGTNAITAETEISQAKSLPGTYNNYSIDKIEIDEKGRENAENHMNILNDKNSSCNEEGTDDDDNVDVRKRVKKLSKKLKKRQVKLGFSDDEDEDEDEISIKSPASDDENSEEDVEIAETCVEYDSEENEIIVQMTKEECNKRAENFFENEAELSDTDCGSADEDENNMDDYDIELGDEDQFDRYKLQEQLVQIHARKMLDEDKRKVREIEEMLFHDNEAEEMVRERKFRWKNEHKFDDMTSEVKDHVDVDNNESGDEDQNQEHLWRKIRFEKIQLQQEMGGPKEDLPLTTLIAKSSTKCTTITTSKLDNIGKSDQTKSNSTLLSNITSSLLSKKNSTKLSSPFLVMKNMTKTTAPETKKTMTSILQPKIIRKSFLTRDIEKLRNNAKSATGGGSGVEVDETAGTVSNKGLNFIFTTISREEHDQLKRKADSEIDRDRDPEKNVNFAKKPRTSVNKLCLIDQLLT